ncbi:MAG TPA: lipid-A-disaccharide synthase N-terminal domain-containing protein [Candidatus Ozemobacteraceae bacterium]|nr:lipid-A-disaccharide synthase N-terminal domain-containing protein [Candidatus Ozemobacteraceae bacterium]
MSARFWLIFGLVGQTMFFMRFLVQWIVSEREKRSVIPVSFWYFSLLGSAILAVYAFHIQDPVFILGQSLGFVIYIRNLMLIKNQQETNELSNGN